MQKVGVGVRLFLQAFFTTLESRLGLIVLKN